MPSLKSLFKVPSQLPKSYTVLIASTGKAPIVLSVKPLPLLIASVVIATIPFAIIGYLIYHSSRLAHRNADLTNTANQVLSELNTLNSDIENLKERAGLSKAESPSSTQEVEKSSYPENSSGVREGEVEEKGSTRPPGAGITQEKYGPPQIIDPSRGGPAVPVGAEALFELAQQKMPALSLALEADVRPALEATLAKEMDRESAFPSAVPLKGDIEISSEFGLRRSPFGASNYEMHEGLDFKGPIGRSVYATADGVVVAASTNNGDGKHVVIDHGYGYTTLYAHLSEFDVEVGDKVQRGDRIGFLGNTGRSSGPHLHYGIYRNGQPINPRYYLKLEDSQL